MKLDKGSLSFNISIDKPGNTPAWGTPLGTKKNIGFPIDKKGANELLSELKVFEYHSIDNGFDREFHKIVNSYRVDRVKINGQIVNGQFFLLLLEQIKGHHKGRKTLKYSKDTGDGQVDNRSFYQSIVPDNSSVMVTDFVFSNGYLDLKLITLSDKPERFESILARDFCLQYCENNDEVSLCAEDIVFIDDSLRCFAFELFKYLISIDKLERIQRLVTKSVGRIKQVSYSAYKLPQYFGTNALFAGFDVERSKQELTTGKSQRYNHVPLDIDYLSERFIYFNYQWSFPIDQNSVTFDELKTFVKDEYNLNIVHLEKGTLKKRTYALINEKLSYTPLKETITIKESKVHAVFKDTIFKSDLLDSGLYFESTLISRFLASLQAKPFVILSGMSGSGKTKLAESFAMYISESPEQWILLPVGADWTNRDALLGFENTLTNDYALPPHNVPEFIFRAGLEENSNKPYFLILDEMNLSIVERYFADFLSAMETSRKTIPLHQLEEDNVPSILKLPHNLFIIGTVNIDETTYMFSPKVLDRANTIEFRLKESDIEDFLNNELNELKLDNLAGKGKNMASSFVSNCKKELDLELTKEIDDLLLKTFQPLKKAGAEFGYRTIIEIRQLANQLNQFNIESKVTRSEESKINKAHAIFDIAILQKLLPKLHGSVGKLKVPLTTLAELCFYDGKWVSHYLNADNDAVYTSEHLRYPLSFEKIKSMYLRLMQNGFVSFAEA